jgi:hypothetical protein
MFFGSSSKTRHHAKRTNPQREEQLRQIAGMYLEGLPQRDIADRFGLSQSQISRDLKEIQRRWATPDSQDVMALRAKELARLDHLEQQAWAAYNRSRQPEETQSKEKTITDNHAGNGQKSSTKGPADRMKASIRTKNRDGNPAFMKIALDCCRQRIKLLGVEAPAKLEDATPKQIQFIRVNGSGDEPAKKADVIPPNHDETDQSLPPTGQGLEFRVVPPVDSLRKALSDFAAESGNP